MRARCASSRAAAWLACCRECRGCRRLLVGLSRRPCCTAGTAGAALAADHGRVCAVPHLSHLLRHHEDVRDGGGAGQGGRACRAGRGSAAAAGSRGAVVFASLLALQLAAAAWLAASDPAPPWRRQPQEPRAGAALGQRRAGGGGGAGRAPLQRRGGPGAVVLPGLLPGGAGARAARLAPLPGRRGEWAGAGWAWLGRLERVAGSEACLCVAAACLEPPLLSFCCCLNGAAWWPALAQAAAAELAAWEQLAADQQSVAAQRRAHSYSREWEGEAARAAVNRPRYCRKCQAWKPPRAHHDSMSGRCVLRMDHYCMCAQGAVKGWLGDGRRCLARGWAGICPGAAALASGPPHSRAPALVQLGAELRGTAELQGGAGPAQGSRGGRAPAGRARHAGGARLAGRGSRLVCSGEQGVPPCLRPHAVLRALPLLRHAGLHGQVRKKTGPPGDVVRRTARARGTRCGHAPRQHGTGSPAPRPREPPRSTPARPPAPCSAALLVRPCIEVFGERYPSLGRLILTFMALVFSVAFRCAGWQMGGRLGCALLGWPGQAGSLQAAARVAVAMCRAAARRAALPAACPSRRAAAPAPLQPGAGGVCHHARPPGGHQQDDDRGVREAPHPVSGTPACVPLAGLPAGCPALRLPLDPPPDAAAADCHRSPSPAPPQPLALRPRRGPQPGGGVWAGAALLGAAAARARLAARAAGRGAGHAAAARRAAGRARRGVSGPARPPPSADCASLSDN